MCAEVDVYRLPLRLSGGQPLYEQIAGGLRDLFAVGGLQPGDRLPSVRDLAADLRVNRNTVARAYKDLEREGLIETRRGGGTRVSQLVLRWSEEERERRLASAVTDLCDEADHLGAGFDEVQARVQLEYHSPERRTRRREEEREVS